METCVRQPTIEEMRYAKFRDDRYTWPFVCLDEQFIQVSTFLPDIDDRYWVSDCGRVFDAKYNCFKNPIFQINGYLSVTLERKIYTDYSQHSVWITIHRLVCMAFHGIPENYKELHVNHIDSVRDNNYYENLEWLTPKENVRHSFVEGNRGVGENSNRNVYPETTIRQICELMQSGIYDVEEICMRVFNCHRNDTLKALIYEVRNRLFWQSVSKEYTFDPTPPKKRALSDEQVHAVCKYISQNPRLMGSVNYAANEIALNALGIDLKSLDPVQEKELRSCINGIKRKNIYKHISSLYF